MTFDDLTSRATATPDLTALFANEPDRLDRMALQVGPLRADFSKQRVSAEDLDALLSLAETRDVAGWRARLFAGEPINSSENRAVLHTALRGVGGEAVADDVAAMRARIATFAAELRQSGCFDDIVHIGIGGSDLGPRLVADAFDATAKAAPRLHFANNVDGASVNDAIAGLNPKRTLVIVVSKSFGTQETKMNAESVRAWLAAANCSPKDHVLAVSANPDRAIAFGIDPDNIFDFWDWVGGRYSVWSAVGLSLAIAYGPELFGELLDGAAQMDRHFRDAPLVRNMPVLMALIGIWNRNGHGYDSLAVIPYARRLRKLAAFLQQLEMESNGKSAGRDGTGAGVTCPVIWGDEGTNGQHAFFQWLHQGPKGAPVDFVAVLTDHENRPDHHRALLANCFAQSEALMLGKDEATVRRDNAERDDLDSLAPQKTFPGNRPSTTLTLDALTPTAIGHLIALYEHKVFVQGVIWGVNSFDQWGVELGKVLADTILSEIEGGKTGDHDPSTSALISSVR
ncbi:glucose-6-phosphate isomerase [Algimonas porphyrae]|uniref:Glucose-6-phosphate isomerase n=1 Tax=Algimonas porphyrae TaxID=1128113 RepID=A0ABQ5V3D2_9PROT|nr:glucose-6-phosphate isomerase [Algimonas porphyrae]GLQ21096.1 glucose-6-phosphate isomerase [Algimonas porphyrae]